MTNAIIQLENVKKIYKMGLVDVRALDGVSLLIKKGEFVSIVGKSGSGKSTLVNQIGSLDVPTEGKVFLDGHDISRLAESTLAQLRGKKIGFIFQTFNLMPTLNVFENVSLPMTFQGVSDEKIKERTNKVLKLVELEDRKHHKPSELSGGQRQRVAIARALVNNPEVILADEPTGNLDIKTGKQIMDFLVKLNEKEKVTIIMVTHDDDLAKWSDRTIVLADGKILKEINNTKKDRLKAIKSIDDEIRKLRKNGER